MEGRLVFNCFYVAESRRYLLFSTHQEETNMGGSTYQRSYSIADQGSATSMLSDQTFRAVRQKAMTTNRMDPAIEPNEDRGIVGEGKTIILIMLDVTGSMGERTKVIYDKLPVLNGQMLGYETPGADTPTREPYCEEPMVMGFVAIGDHRSDQFPLQITDFAEGDKMDANIEKLVLEGNGGGNEVESYAEAAAYVLSNVEIRNCDRAFCFIIGDEGFYDTAEVRLQKGEEPLANERPKNVGGKRVVNRASFRIFQQLAERFDTYVLRPTYFRAHAETRIQNQWVDALGEERILPVGEGVEGAKATADIIRGIVAVSTGVRNVDTYDNDLKRMGQTTRRRELVRRSLENVAPTQPATGVGRRMFE